MFIRQHRNRNAVVNLENCLWLWPEADAELREMALLNHCQNTYLCV